MRRHRIGCLPVVQDGHIIAIVTEEDFVGIAGKVLTEAASSADVTAFEPQSTASLGASDEGDAI
jgi:CBS domain-containing protein